MRRIFVDRALQKDLEEDGFVVSTLLNATHVLDLLSKYEELTPRGQEGWHRTNDIESASIRHKIGDTILEIIGEELRNILVDYRIPHVQFAAKHPGDNGFVRAHIDPSIVKEEQFTSLVLWIPLTDVNRDNGCLHFARGSHKLMPHPRGHDPFPSLDFVRQLLERLPKEDQQALPLKRGNVVMFHPAIAHWSAPNRTHETRVAVQGNAIPQEAELIHCEMNPSGDVERFRVHETYLLDMKHPKEPTQGEFVDIVPYVEPGVFHQLSKG